MRPPPRYLQGAGSASYPEIAKFMKQLHHSTPGRTKIRRLNSKSYPLRRRIPEVFYYAAAGRPTTTSGI
ncbi:hypothetical protein DPMN_192234 [Dreissena polymorpha]|uniref:Uncharacterized protein n=1 Tax=Dreissena polymorpha TaxID=45954 RepID=A0A9D3XW67_DREPO|nr:hypothetical protein DPMN_192234 [Dreissena polymorpha]